MLVRIIPTYKAASLWVPWASLQRPRSSTECLHIYIVHKVIPLTRLAHPIPKDCELNDLKHFSHPYLLFQSSILIRIHFPHKTIWTQLVWHFKNSLSPSQSLILFFPLLLSPVNPSKWNIHYSSSVQITEFWESTMKLLTPLGFYCYYTIIQLWLLPNKFIHSTSQPVTTKLSPIHYLSTRVRHCTPVKKT